MSSQYLETIENNITANNKQQLPVDKDQSGNNQNAVNNGDTDSVDLTISVSNAANDNSLSSNTTTNSLKDVNMITTRSIELQNALERQSKELAESRIRLSDLQTRHGL